MSAVDMEELYEVSYSSQVYVILPNGCGKVNARFGIALKFSGLNKSQLCMTKG